MPTTSGLAAKLELRVSELHGSEPCSQFRHLLCRRVHSGTVPGGCDAELGSGLMPASSLTPKSQLIIGGALGLLLAGCIGAISLRDQSEPPAPARSLTTTPVATMNFDDDTDTIALLALDDVWRKMTIEERVELCLDVAELGPDTAASVMLARTDFRGSETVISDWLRNHC